MQPPRNPPYAPSISSSGETSQTAYHHAAVQQGQRAACPNRREAGSFITVCLLPACSEIKLMEWKKLRESSFPPGNSPWYLEGDCVLVTRSHFAGPALGIFWEGSTSKSTVAPSPLRAEDVPLARFTACRFTGRRQKGAGSFTHKEASLLSC